MKKFSKLIQFIFISSLAQSQIVDLFISDFYSKSSIKLTPKKTNITKQKKVYSLTANEKKIIEKFCEEDIDLYQKLKNQIEKK